MNKFWNGLFKGIKIIGIALIVSIPTAQTIQNLGFCQDIHYFNLVAQVLEFYATMFFVSVMILAAVLVLKGEI